MGTSQSGIFALGTASHAYLELDAGPGATARELVQAVASLREPRTTMGGVNLVVGFRPELWREVVPDDAPAGVEGFNARPRRRRRLHDAGDAARRRALALGSAYDVIFDTARAAIAELGGPSRRWRRRRRAGRTSTTAT